MSEYDFEPIRGLPGNLPPGESILWQGAPDWRALACEAFHIRAVAAYFAAMLVWRMTGEISAGVAPLKAVGVVASVAPLAAVALALLAFLAWLNSRTTVYTITNRRVVMRFGAALTKAFNIPFGIIEGAALNARPSGGGDLALTLKAPNKIAFLHLWPHARPFRLGQPQPTFRAIPDAARAARILTDAIRDVVAVDVAAATPAAIEDDLAAALPHAQAA